MIKNSIISCAQCFNTNVKVATKDSDRLPQVGLVAESRVVGEEQGAAVERELLLGRKEGVQLLEEIPGRLRVTTVIGCLTNWGGALVS